MGSKVRGILDKLINEPNSLKSFREDPKEFSKTHNLDKETEDSLLKADLLMVSKPVTLDPLDPFASVTTYTFTTGTTITGDTVRGKTLNDLEKPELVSVINRMVTDMPYFLRVADYISE